MQRQAECKREKARMRMMELRREVKRMRMMLRRAASWQWKMTVLEVERCSKWQAEKEMLVG